MRFGLRKRSGFRSKSTVGGDESLPTAASRSAGYALGEIEMMDAQPI
jgi:hypothetical protein